MGWLAIDGWLAACSGPSNQPVGRRRTEDGNNKNNNKPRSTDEGRLSQSIFRGWRPLIEAPPPFPRGAAAPSCLVDTPVSQGADETGVPGAVAWKRLSPSCLCRCRCRFRCTVRVVLAILRMQV